MAFPNTKPHMSLLLATFMTCFLLLLSKGMSADSISFTYNTFPNDLRDIAFRGDARVTDGHLLLTRLDASGNPVGGSQGQAVFGYPIRLWESSTGRAADFETTFTFIIRSTSSNKADGLTFFLNPVDTPIPPGSGGGNLGIYGPNGSNQFLAVEFDTFRNTWDPNTTPHIGIDINNVTSVRTARWNTVAVPNGSTARVTITYSANSKELRASLSYTNAPGSVTSTLTYGDLDITNHLPEWVQVGFSAATGNYVQEHQILSWSFNSNLISRSISEDFIKEVI